MNGKNYPLIMTQEYWMNSQLSVARHYGKVKVFGHEYWIVDKLGRDLYECTHIANKEGRSKAIMPGEPADLCVRSLVPAYRKLGRERIIQAIKDNMSEEEIMELAGLKKQSKRKKQ